MENYVLDSFALLTYFNREAGHGIVSDLLLRTINDARLYMSIMSLGELVYIFERRLGLDQANAMLADLRRLPVVLCAVDESRILDAAHIKAQYPLAYADAFVVALAQEINATIVTGDPEFAQISHLAPILWLRPIGP